MNGLGLPQTPISSVLSSLEVQLIFLDYLLLAILPKMLFLRAQKMILSKMRLQKCCPRKSL